MDCATCGVLPDTRATFHNYFKDGLAPAEALQAEWRWLHASSNKISRDERRELMTAFQKATVWQGYFARRLLKHAYNRVAARQVFYEKLVLRMPESAAQSIRALGDSMYEDAGEVLKQIHEEEWRFYSLAADNPYYLTVLEQVLAEMKKVHKEPQVMASYFAQKAAFASARRRGRIIKVQPTGIVRCRPGVARGADRVRAGRPSKRPGCKKTKRPHALHLSVKSGVAHAKSHGTGH
ncbi:hypothetical protein MTO96_023999 [Rhipicephalus appendiculatus]